MPSYFFHVREGDAETRDPTGSEWPDDVAAFRRAVESARNVVASKLRAGQVIDGRTIEVADATGRTVAVVALQEVLKTQKPQLVIELGG